MLRSLFLSTLFLFIALFSFAQTTAPKYSNEFLNIGIGARAFAMQAQTAVTSDVTSAYWNPAGLLELPSKYEVGLMHSEYFAGIAQYEYAGIATKLDSNSSLGVTMIRFAIDDIPNTLNLIDANGIIDYSKVTFFTASDYAFLLSYARKLPGLKGVSTGANVKVIHRIVGNFATNWGFGIDLGAKYNKNGWQLGVMARDITSTFNAWSHNISEVQFFVYQNTGNEIPQNSIEVTLPRLILGAGKSFLIKNKIGVLATADIITTFDGRRNTVASTDWAAFEPAAGVEIDYKKFLFLRGGVGNFQKIQGFENRYTSFQPNFGLGVKVYRFTIDYALTDLGNTSEALYSNVFSLKVNLN